MCFVTCFSEIDEENSLLRIAHSYSKTCLFHVAVSKTPADSFTVIPLHIVGILGIILEVVTCLGFVNVQVTEQPFEKKIVGGNCTKKGKVPS